MAQIMEYLPIHRVYYRIVFQPLDWQMMTCQPPMQRLSYPHPNNLTRTFPPKHIISGPKCCCSHSSSPCSLQSTLHETKSLRSPNISGQNLQSFCFFISLRLFNLHQWRPCSSDFCQNPYSQSNLSWGMQSVFILFSVRFYICQQ